MGRIAMRLARRCAQGAFTLIELMVVIAIIGVLLGLLLPAVQATREAARRSQCTNNLKQIALALHNYTSANGVLPMSMALSGAGNTTSDFGGWSVFIRILPYIEQTTVYSAANFALSNEHPANATVVEVTMLTYLCPNEVKPTASKQKYGRAGVINYGVCQGDWFVWGGFNGPQNHAAFGPNRCRQIMEFTDGTSNTLFAAEVKSYTAASHCGHTTLPSVNDPNNIPSPNAAPYAVAPEYDNGSCITQNQSAFHTAWSDGSVHASGFTTAWTPNRTILGRSAYRDLDLDLKGRDEVGGGPTFAAINARSYHPGGVNVVMADGSARFVKNTISGSAWRAVGTVDGGEVTCCDCY
jgi:prepilin-type N-terminal cleavage/methylation domain-containing protein/prepilin-type processing-associated H-X9-DG protein